MPEAAHLYPTLHKPHFFVFHTWLTWLLCRQPHTRRIQEWNRLGQSFMYSYLFLTNMLRTMFLVNYKLLFPILVPLLLDFLFLMF